MAAAAAAHSCAAVPWEVQSQAAPPLAQGAHQRQPVICRAQETMQEEHWRLLLLLLGCAISWRWRQHLQQAEVVAPAAGVHAAAAPALLHARCRCCCSSILRLLLLGQSLEQGCAAASNSLSCCNIDAHALAAAAAPCRAGDRSWLQQGLRPGWQQILSKPAERCKPMRCAAAATASAAAAVQRRRQLGQLGNAQAALKR